MANPLPSFFQFQGNNCFSLQVLTLLNICPHSGNKILPKHPNLNGYLFLWRPHLTQLIRKIKYWTAHNWVRRSLDRRTEGNYFDIKLLCGCDLKICLQSLTVFHSRGATQFYLECRQNLETLLSRIKRKWKDAINPWDTLKRHWASPWCLGSLDPGEASCWVVKTLEKSWRYVESRLATSHQPCESVTEAGDSTSEDSKDDCCSYREPDQARNSPLRHSKLLHYRNCVIINMDLV